MVTTMMKMMKTTKMMKMKITVTDGNQEEEAPGVEDLKEEGVRSLNHHLHRHATFLVSFIQITLFYAVQSPGRGRGYMTYSRTGCVTEILQTHPLIISRVYKQTIYYDW